MQEPYSSSSWDTSPEASTFKLIGGMEDVDRGFFGDMNNDRDDGRLNEKVMIRLR